MEIPEQILVAIIGVVPALAVPLAGSLVQRSCLAQKTRKMEAIKKRMDIVESLLRMEDHLSSKTKKAVQAELAEIASEVLSDRERERLAEGIVVRELPAIRRFLLLFVQPSIKASVYRATFWVFFFVGVGGGVLAFPFQLLLGNVEALPFIPVSMLLYATVGILFRWFALRQRKLVHLSPERF